MNLLEEAPQVISRPDLRKGAMECRAVLLPFLMKAMSLSDSALSCFPCERLEVVFGREAIVLG